MQIESKILNLFRIHLYTKPYDSTPCTEIVKILQKLSYDTVAAVATLCTYLEEAIHEALGLPHPKDTIASDLSDVMYHITMLAGPNELVGTVCVLVKLADRHNLFSTSNKAFQESQLSSSCRLLMVTQITNLVQNMDTVGQGMQLLLWLCNFDWQTNSLYEDYINVTPIIAFVLYWLQSNSPPPGISAERFKFLKVLSIRCIKALLKVTSNTTVLARWWTEEQQSIRPSEARIDEIYLLLANHLEHPEYMVEVLQAGIESSTFEYVTMETACRFVNSILLAFQRVAYSGGQYQTQHSGNHRGWSGTYQDFMRMVQAKNQEIFEMVALVHLEHTANIIQVLNTHPPVTSLVPLKQLASQQVHRDYATDDLPVLPAEITVGSYFSMLNFFRNTWSICSRHWNSNRTYSPGF